jgi:hypothetical protein
MMLVRSRETQAPPPPALTDAIARLAEEGIRSGTMIATGGLCGGVQGARVRLAGGQLTVTDGPYSEAKEIIGGYAVFELASKDAAVDAARAFMEVHREHWPGWEGETEVRQMME